MAVAGPQFYMDEKLKLSKKEGRGGGGSFMRNSSHGMCSFTRKCSSLVKEQRARAKRRGGSTIGGSRVLHEVTVSCGNKVGVLTTETVNLGACGRQRHDDPAQDSVKRCGAQQGAGRDASSVVNGHISRQMGPREFMVLRLLASYIGSRVANGRQQEHERGWSKVLRGSRAHGLAVVGSAATSEWGAVHVGGVMAVRSTISWFLEMH
ncbi:hypothetical protein MRB53_029266 [Persea americana]|uniref:Uncharacterized protein n=1 Tax=Persea americana TaxID=3435 RepID=A0ACC2KI89_PERAE|nr:hypothetical protein MRB53_029266 [Persea americana]